MSHLRLDADFLYAACMVRTKGDIPGKSPVLKEGMIICYVDPRDWKDDILLSHREMKAFGWFMLNRSLKNDLIEACLPEETRARKNYFSFNSLGAKLGRPNLKKDFEDPDMIVEPIPGTGMDSGDFKESKEHTWP